MALRFYTVKEITAHLSVNKDKVANQFARLGLRKAWITDEEKAMLFELRKRKGLIRDGN